jgi:hypothetical protein
MDVHKVAAAKMQQMGNHHNHGASAGPNKGPTNGAVPQQPPGGGVNSPKPVQAEAAPASGAASPAPSVQGLNKPSA